MDFSKLFSSSEQSFLNAGSLARCPLEILDLMEKRRRLEEQNPTLSILEGAAQIWKAQESLARTFKASAEDFFLRSNITHALNDFLFALELPQGSKVFTTDLEYGATANILKERCKAWDASLNILEIPPGPKVKRADLLAAFEGKLKGGKLLLLSHIVTGTGTIFPLQEIVREAHKQGLIVVVDGAHGPGALPINLSAIGADFYGGNLHKWYMAPRGTAFGWVNPACKEKLHWKFGGWASFGKPPSYHAYLGSDESARRMLSGTMDLIPFQMIQEMEAKFWTPWESEVRSVQTKRRDFARAKMHELGFESISPESAELHGPLVTFSLPSQWPQGTASEWVRSLWKDAGVQVAFPMIKGKFYLRLSPGCYSSEGEISRGILALNQWRISHA